MLDALRGCGALCRDIRGCDGLVWPFLGGLLLTDATGHLGC